MTDDADQDDGGAAPDGAPAPDTRDTRDTPDTPDTWDRAAAWVMRRGALPALGLVTLLLAALYAHVFDGEVAGDDLTFHMAESARIADCLRAWDFDLWNPSANGGFASLYYYQAVPQLASAIPAALLGHHLFFFQLSVFLPLVLAPAAAYRGLRVMGATPWQAAIGALAVGMLNGESRWGTGNAGTFIVGLYTQTWALAAFPLALGHAVRWASSARGLAPAIAWGTFVTLCHPFAGVSLAIALVVGLLAQLALRALDGALAALGRALTRDRSDDVHPGWVSALAARWCAPPPRPWLGPLGRLALLGACLAAAWAPIWLPLVVDYAGFGGFPHRVADEVGPGFQTLLAWYREGKLFDFGRPPVLTWAIPLVLVAARAPFLAWLWAPVFVFAVWLGLGPHLGKTDDDLVPAVRFLGAMQVMSALAIGAGALAIARRLWDAPEGSPTARAGRSALLFAAIVGFGALVWALATGAEESSPVEFAQRATLHLLPTGGARAVAIGALVAAIAIAVRPAWTVLATPYGLRTALAAIGAALGVLLVLPGSQALESRVHVLPDYAGSHGDELLDIAQRLQREPPGRKQVGEGAVSHWWNLLTYVYGRRPSLLMMGGGGLQASPNYDFLFSVRDLPKHAWVYDAPLLVFDKKHAEKMPVGDEVLETAHFQVRRLPAPGLVSPVEVIGTLPPGRKAAHAAALTWYEGEEPQHDQVLAYDGSGGPGGPPQGKVTRAFRQDSPGDAADIYAEVEVAAPTTFLARESWHPRWHAFIDGVEVPVRRLSPNFPAVDVPAGAHVLAWRFERPWWAHAAWLAGPLITLLAWVATRRSARGG